MEKNWKINIYFINCTANNEEASTMAYSRFDPEPQPRAASPCAILCTLLICTATLLFGWAFGTNPTFRHTINDAVTNAFYKYYPYVIAVIRIIASEGFIAFSVVLCCFAFCMVEILADCWERCKACCREGNWTVKVFFDKNKILR